jgi:2-dehydro-3-deoxygluconokinase
MLRLNPPGFLRFGQAGSFEVSFGGGEANVSASLANFGIETDFVTRLPKNDLGDACLAYLRRYARDLEILQGEAGSGFFLENAGARAARSSLTGSSGLGHHPKGMLDGRHFCRCDWFHWTGITPLSASRSAKSVSMDLKAGERAAFPVI